MKRFPRFLQFLPLLLLMVMNYEAVAQTEKALPPKITSFTTNSTRVFKGNEVVLSWRVFHAEHIWLSHGQLLNEMECLKETFGEIRVAPEKDTTYRLYAWTRQGHVFQEIKVQVIEPTGSCTIMGLVSRDKEEYATTIGLYSPGSANRLFSMPVDDTGQYTFLNVPAGVYDVMPKGRYPLDRFSIGPIPRSRRVVCEQNVRHQVNFRIGSNEG
jgi:hypothetical protein